jgi:putative ABC transport system substrate-binding protein
MRFVKVGVCSVLAVGCHAATLVAATPQPGRIPRVSSLQIWSPSDPREGVLRQALRDVGYVEGQTIVVEHRWAEGRADRLPALAAELVQLKVDAIMAAGEPAILAAQQATKTIPIVAASDDLVGAGLVASLARPGGNTTGISILASELNAKRLELLKETLPLVSHMAALWDPGTGISHLKSLEAAARSLRIELQILEVRSPDGFRSAFEAAKKGRAGALNVLASPLLHGYQKTSWRPSTGCRPSTSGGRWRKPAACCRTGRT